MRNINWDSEDEVLAEIRRAHSGGPMSYASDRLRSDRAFVMRAAIIAPPAIECSLLNYKEGEIDKDFLLQVCRQNASGMEYAESYWSDKEMVLAAMSADPKFGLSFSKLTKTQWGEIADAVARDTKAMAAAKDSWAERIAGEEPDKREIK